MLKLELVVHCFHYAKLLGYQLSSLAHHPPRDLALTVTVCYTPDDASTAAALAFFGGVAVPNVAWAWRPLAQGRVLRRAYGRNLAALATGADWVWFADCDYLFGPGCLDAFPAAVAAPAARGQPLLFPRDTKGTTHPGGAALIAAAAGPPRVLPFPGPEFWEVPLRNRKAIGGIQIVPREVSLAKGYLKTWRRFRRELGGGWRRPTEDKFFRADVGSPRGTPIDLPGLYRIRHEVGDWQRPGHLEW